MSKHSQMVLTTLIVAIVLVSGSLLISSWLLPPPEEPTPLLGLLNEDLQAGPFPTNITQYQNITLNVEVGNFMGVVQYFYLRVKLATNETMATVDSPSSAPLLIEFERIFSKGGSWIFPIELNMTTSGINYRLTFELWRYDSTTDITIYTGTWLHLPLNVTAP